MDREVSELLRARPVMPGPLPGFDADTAPRQPGELFLRWLAEAVDAEVTEPQLAVVGTADARGRPSSRVLLLRDVRLADDGGVGFVFASSAASRKGRELAENPWAALCFYWSEQGRQVRAGGPVTAGTPEENAREFLSRAPQARLASLTGRQSAVLAGFEEYEAAWRKAERLLAEHPESVPADYTVYILWADELEFWQGDTGRRHIRLRYRRDERGWTRELLWP